MMVGFGCEIDTQQTYSSNQIMVGDLSVRKDNRACIEPHKILGHLFVEEIIMKKIDLTGQRFGRLMVLKEVGRTKGRHVRWLCQCDCGGTTTGSGSDLRRGHINSCGCLQKQLLSENNRKRQVSQETRGRMSRAQRLLTGEKAHRWKGGITPKIKLIRHSKEYQRFRLTILKRDKFKCTSCGQVGGEDLHVHHILPTDKYQDLIFDENNVTTLCHGCHTKLHNKIKRKEN